MSDVKLKRDDLGNRMKDYYEQIPKTKLMRRCPVICRLDGRSFHTFTRGFQRPFDDVFTQTMQETAQYLCENIQGTVLAYTQSDEISLVLIDYQSFETSAWFDYEVQKMCSIAAGMATLAFNRFFAANYREWREANLPELDLNGANNKSEEAVMKLEKAYSRALERGAVFDARVFNIPKEEVTNCIFWRQLDASRNSIQMVGQAYFSQKELQNKSCSTIQDMLMTQKGINWNDFPVYQKRGSCCIKEEYSIEKENRCLNDTDAEAAVRTRWIIDKEIPIFKGEDRQYIERLIQVGD